MSYISLETGVIKVGDNLHLILPEGTFPLSVASGVSSPGTPVFTPVTPALTTVPSVLTPIAQVLKSPLVLRPKYQAVAQRYGTAHPIIIPPLGRKPCFTSTFASSPVSSSGSQQATHVTAKVRNDRYNSVSGLKTRFGNVTSIKYWQILLFVTFLFGS